MVNCLRNIILIGSGTISITIHNVSLIIIITDPQYFYPS